MLRSAFSGGGYNAVIERDIYCMKKWLTIKTQDVKPFQYFINEHTYMDVEWWCSSEINREWIDVKFLRCSIIIV